MVDKTLIMLTGYEFTTEKELTDCQSELSKWSSFLDEWRAIYVQLLTAKGYARALSGCLSQLSKEDRDSYDESRKVLNSAHGYLQKGSVQELTSYNVATLVHQSWSTLHELWEANGLPKIPPPEHKEKKGSGSGRMAPKNVMETALDYTDLKLILVKYKYVFADVSASSLSFFSAVAAGLLALYFTNNTFGGVQDYMACFLWGGGVDQSVKGLSAVLQKLGITAPSA